MTSSLKIFCLTVGDDPRKVFEIEITKTASVARLSDAIEKRFLDLQLGPSDFTLHQVSIPAEKNLEGLKNLESSMPEALDATTELLELFQEPPKEKHVHILVQPIATQYAEASDEPLEAVEYAQLVQSMDNPDPAIYDGLYAPSTSRLGSTSLMSIAPPIHVFHPIFESFLRDANDPSLELSDEFLIRTQTFMSFASQLKAKETTPNPSLLNKLSELIDVSVQTMGDVEVPLCLSELKRNIGGGHSDPVIQAGCSMKQWFQPDRSRMRDRCCCPTFILAGGGPWLCILGAVITHRVIVQRLTDMMWIGLSSTNEDDRIRRFARVMAALSQNLSRLREYYERVDTAANIPPYVRGRAHPRLYPHPKSFTENGETVHFEYVKRLEADAGCVTYLAKIRRDAESPNVDQRVVIKFVDQYGDEVHRFLAGRDCAPKLRYYGPLPVDDFLLGDNPPAAPPTTASSGYLFDNFMKMVVMDYVEPHPRPAGARAQLEAILTDLHTAGYVFGDLREPNVLFDGNGRAKLIDFDWAGRYDMGGMDKSAETEFVRYPLGLSPNITWAEGVGPLAPIRPEHDWGMLSNLRWN